MPAGRPSKPTAIKKLEGNPGKRAINHAEPIATGQPAPPKTMSKAAATIWKRVVGSMPRGVWTGADENLLAAYCEAAALHHEAADKLKTEPKVSIGSTGQAVVSPWVKIMADQARLMASLGARLGLDPMARQAINAPEDDKPVSRFDFN